MLHEALLRDLASRYVWWLPADRAVDRQDLLLCQLMQLGTAQDVRAARRALGDHAFREALSSAPPGVLDARSWTFWHLVLFHSPPPPLPVRPLPT
jgi:hypothetical protein